MVQAGMEAASLSFHSLSSPPNDSTFCCLPAIFIFDLFNESEHAEHTKHVSIVKMAYKTLAFECKYVSVSIRRNILAVADFWKCSTCHLADFMFASQFRCSLSPEINLQNTLRHYSTHLCRFRCYVLPFRW